MTVTFDPSATGVRSTTLTIASNDSDEAAYDFTLQGTGTNTPPPTTQIIDNGDAGFSAQGFTTYGQGYQSDIHFSAAGSGSNSATWTFAVTPGQYEVAATWTKHKNRATDSPFTVLNGSTVLSTVDVNQEQAPNDFSDAGANWERLGTFTISGSQLIVSLTNSANQYVIADAIRINRLSSPPPPSGAEINVLGNSVSIVDGDTTPSAADATDFGTVLVSSGSATKTYTIQNVGGAALSLSAVGVTGGASSDYAVSSFPSSIAAGGSATVQVVFDPSAAGARTTTMTIVSNDADEGTYNFTIQGTGSNTPPPPPSTTQIIDNGDAGFSAPSFTSYGQGYQGDIHFSAAGNGSNLATWTFSVTAGQYEVAATWTKHSNRAKDAPFTVLNGSTTLSTIDINQEKPPNDFTDQNVPWERLGNFTITGNQLVVRLTNDADQYVIADAIRIERIGNRTSGKANTSPWQNPDNPANVSGDLAGAVSAIDVLLVMNEINRPQFSDPVTRQLTGPYDTSDRPLPYLDTNGDGRVTAIDALLAINAANEQRGREADSLSADETDDLLAPIVDDIARTWIAN